MQDDSYHEANCSCNWLELKFSTLSTYVNYSLFSKVFCNLYYFWIHVSYLLKPKSSSNQENVILPITIVLQLYPLTISLTWENYNFLRDICLISTELHQQFNENVSNFSKKQPSISFILLCKHFVHIPIMVI